MGGASIHQWGHKHEDIILLIDDDWYICSKKENIIHPDKEYPIVVYNKT